VRKNPASIILASVLALAATATTALSTTGCDGGTDGVGGSGGGGGAGGTPDTACPSYDTADYMSPAVSFKADVLPFFQQSCGVSTSCHGDSAQPNDNRPYLGPNKDTMATQADIDLIFEKIVGVGSFAEPGMNLVEPGDPKKSFLMFKLDDQLECSSLTCAENKDCGGIMPVGASMPMAEREDVRRWIAQGAQNN
jgi:hypothetical protein